MEFQIPMQWDSKPIDHRPVVLRLKPNDLTSFALEVDAPFFNDPPTPPGTPGQPLMGLWDYEVAELFLANDKNQYVEIEVCPWGQHIVLLLDGVRNAIRHSLPLEFTWQRNETSWTGRAVVPVSYLPPNVTKMNAYAIHGSDENRIYESLHPVPSGSFPNPDFHRLEFFKPIDLSQLVPVAELQKLSPTWSDALNG